MVAVTSLGSFTIFGASKAEESIETEAIEETTENTEESEDVSYVCYAQSVNALSDEIDYKVTEDDFNQLWKFSNVNYGSMQDLTLNKGFKEGSRLYTDADIVTDSRDTEYYQARSWLINNGYLERPVTVKADASGIVAERLQDDWIAKGQYADKSDLVTMLYRGLYSSISSRSLNVTGIGVDKLEYIFSLYQTGRVYEQYLQACLEKGLINKSDLIEGDLTSSSWDSEYVWSESKGIVGLLPEIDDDGKPTGERIWSDCTGILGNAYTYEFKNDKLTITPKVPEYFKDETMTFIDALEVIENFMKNTEKQITDTEADIIAYKYGVEYLSELSEDEYHTVEFLIAKGVLNFETYDDIGFFENVKWDELLPIIYRVINPDARFNFSMIQLTDGEAFWQEKGFSNSSFTLTVPNNGTEYVLSTDSVTENATEVSVLGKLFGVSAAGKSKKYTVVKDFDTINTYKYNGVNVSELFSLMDKGLLTSSPEIASIKKETVNDIEVYRMTLNIVATSSTRAVQIVDDRIAATIKDASVYKVSGVLKIKDSKEVRMISKSVLESCFGDKIDVIEDKVLSNVGTGAMACILPESKYALVGNQVFVDENLLEVATDNEIYYNFDVISSLLGMSVIQFYSKSVNTQKIASNVISYDTKLYGSSGTLIGKTEYLAAETVLPGDTSGFDLGKDVTEVVQPQYYYNVNQVANGLNTVYRIFYKKFGKSNSKKEPYIVKVDWVYAVPSLEDFNVNSILPSEAVSGTATWQDVFTALYTPPEEGTALRAWWDSNIAMSQGLTTMLFGQPKTQFIKCGYMVPKVTVLLPKSAENKYGGEDSLKTVSSLLVSAGFKIPSEYGKYFGNSTSDFLTKYFKDYTGFSATSADYTALKSFAALVRKCDIQFAEKYKKSSSVVFGDEYYVEGFQVLYRNLNSDSGRIEYNAADDKTLNYMKTKDRVATDSAIPTVGTIVSYKVNGTEKKYVYAGIVAKQSGSGTRQYVALIPVYDGVENDAVEFKMTKTGGSGSSTRYSTSYSTSSSWSIDVQQRFYSVFGMTTERIEADPWLKSTFESPYGTDIFKLWKCASSYLKKGTTKYGMFYQGKVGVYKPSNGGYTAITPAHSVNVKAIPTIYLPSGDYYVYRPSESEDWTIGTGRIGYVLNQSTIYYSGIVDGIIDAILASSVKTTTIDNLDSGTTLYINDTKWIKNGDEWCSYPICNSTAASIAVRGASNALKAFTSIFSATPIECDGIAVPLSNYVNTCTLGTKYAKKTPKNQHCIVLGDDGKVRVVKRTKSGLKTASKSVAPRYSVFSVSFKDSLLVRPLSSDGSVYKVCDTASERVYSGQSIPFFSEDLNYEKTDKTSFNLSQSSFENTATFTIEKEDFNQDYKEEWRADFKTLVAMWIIAIASYLMIISWAVYIGITKGTIAFIFEAIAGKSRLTGKSHGVDLIKLVSLSLYSLDSPPVFGRCIVVTVICLIIVGICITFI